MIDKKGGLRDGTLEISMRITATRMALGELADAALLSSVRVLPTKLLRSGYEFRFPKSPYTHVEQTNAK
ncbi:MAG TPA: DUF1731 domain-containing protein [Candidatus Bathyarchaeia archaeon]|nr:DUF1731 domain-containing protein [Candidatus Bathyarchaeia archaeon]